MKDEKEKAITQFYPDYEYEDEEEEKEEIRIIKPDIANRFRPNRPKFTVNLATNFLIILAFCLSILAYLLLLGLFSQTRYLIIFFSGFFLAFTKIPLNNSNSGFR